MSYFIGTTPCSARQWAPAEYDQVRSALPAAPTNVIEVGMLYLTGLITAEELTMQVGIARATHIRAL